jgi:ABC-type branched-subunit amino acid transport system substrate-binding protein
MQVFKKFYALVLVGLLIGCKSASIPSLGETKYSIAEIDETAFSSSNFRVGVLLPLTGDVAKFGQGMQNAVLMAFEDMKNPNLILQFYDTQSTPQGAQEAAETALKQKVQMIIGPLTSDNVQAVSYKTKRTNIPVVAFSTDISVLQNQVYTLGLLVDEQVNRIVSYAANRRHTKLALLVPDNSTGISVAKSAVAAAKKNGAIVVRIAFYEPNTSDFSEIIRQLSDFEKRAAPIMKEKQKLTPLAEKDDEAAKRQLQRISNKETAFKPDFDAVLIPESGAKLKSISAMFGYYDVYGSDVKFLGTSVWENTRLNKENNVIGGWYPALSRNHNAYFNKKYNTLFGQYPNSLYAFAYDAVALASVLAKQKPEDINAAITTSDGFIGISGVFRMFKNGKNEHSLDIMEVTKTGDVVVSLAPKRFNYTPDFHEDRDVAYWYDEHPPLVFGKDTSVAERMIFGRQLSDEFRTDGYYDEDVINRFRSE